MQKQHVYKPVCCLLGDIGGTNIRLQLAIVQPPHDKPNQVLKSETLEVVKFQNLLPAFLEFLKGAKVYPQIAIIGIAGPVSQNKVLMANVLKWGELNGEFFKDQLKLRHFEFINDFTSISYGLLVMPSQNFVSINGLNVNENKVRGVIGPGTGLGNSVMFCSPFRKRNRVYVLASEGGHTDFTYSGKEDQIQYFNFFKQKKQIDYISLERSFCGPSLPYMFQYYASKHSDWKDADKIPSPQQIIKACHSQQQQNNQKSLYMMTLRLFIRLYSNAIGNFLSHHMCEGGIYIVGSLTKSILPFIVGKDILKDFKIRHHQIAGTLSKIPIVYSKEVDLGLKGAFVFARRIISDEQHD